jgi:hypothetical protein
MKGSVKIIIAIVIVFAMAIGAIWMQRSASSQKEVRLTKRDMEVLVSDIMPPAQQQQLATNPEQKKMLAKRLKELLAIAQVAEREGYADRPEVKAQIALQSDLALQDAYRKKNPGVQVSDEEVNAYYQQHPNDFDAFLDANPQYKAQAQGPQAEGMKKEFGQIKVIGDRARKEGLDKDEAARLRLLLERSQALARAYVNELQKNSDKLVSDADIEQYYREHPEEFEEVRARHILISTSSDAAEDDVHGLPKGAGDKPKALSKDEARKKAQSILDRLRKGEDFARLAGEFSDDPGSKTQGGDLGFFTKGSMVPEFEQTAFSLKPGETSDLVESQFGFHIIKVEERRPKPLDSPETRQQLTEKLKQTKLEKRIEEIAAASKVEVAEDFEVNPAPAAQPPLTLPGGVPPPPPAGEPQQQ